MKLERNAFLADEGQPGAPAFWPMFHRPAPMEQMHWHGHLEVVYLTSGTLCYDLHGLQMELPPRRIGMLWAFFPHRVASVTGEGSAYVFNIPAHAFRSWALSADLRYAVLNGNMVLADAESPYGEAMLQAWLNDGRQANTEKPVLALREIEQMIHRLDIEGWHLVGGTRSNRKVMVGGQTRPGDRVWQMLRFVDLNYMNDISVSDIARHAGLHPNYAMTVFREAMGITLLAYLNQIRLTEAQHLLLSTRKKLFTVAREAGFGSQSRFFSVFREQFATTPTQYRKRSVNPTMV